MGVHNVFIDQTWISGYWGYLWIPTHGQWGCQHTKYININDDNICMVSWIYSKNGTTLEAHVAFHLLTLSSLSLRAEDSFMLRKVKFMNYVFETSWTKIKSRSSIKTRFSGVSIWQIVFKLLSVSNYSYRLFKTAVCRLENVCKQT